MPRPDPYIPIDTVAPPLVAELCDTFFFGLYTAFFAFSAFIMLRKRQLNRTRNTMLVVSVVMYAVSATHWALNTAITVTWSSVGNVFLPPSEVMALIFLPTINVILGDCIVLWRAWVLWDRMFIFKLFIPPLIFMLCTTLISVVCAVFAYESSRTKSVRQTEVVHILGWCISGLTISTNIWSTCLIFVRAWQYRRFLCSQFDKENATSKAKSALLFLVESGALYLCIWLTFIIVKAVPVASPVVLLLRMSIVQFVGIYPTVIFVVVTMRMSAADILSQLPPETHHHSSAMIFTPPSPTSQPSTLAMTVGSSSDSGFFVESREDVSTRTLASSDPEKGGGLSGQSGQNMWHD